jgi:hypothetical protein
MEEKVSNIIQPNWKQVLGIWWWLYWRLFSTLLVIVFISSFIGGSLKGVFLEYQSQISGFLFLFSSIFFVKRLFTHSKFKEYSVVLLRND